MAMHRALKSEIVDKPRRTGKKGPGRHAAGVPLAAYDDLPAAPIEVAIEDDFTVDDAAIDDVAAADTDAATVEPAAIEIPTVDEPAPAIFTFGHQVAAEDTSIQPAADSFDVLEDETATDGSVVVEEIDATAKESTAEAVVNESAPTATDEAIVIEDEPIIATEPVGGDAPVANEGGVIVDEGVGTAEVLEDAAEIIEPSTDEEPPAAAADLVVAEMVAEELAPVAVPDPAQQVHIHHHYHEAAEQQAPQVIIAGPPIYMNEWPTDVPVAPLPQRAPAPVDYDEIVHEAPGPRTDTYAPIPRQERPAKKAKKAKVAAPLPEKEPFFTWRGRPIGKKYQEQAPYIAPPRAIEAAPVEQAEPKRRPERRSVVAAETDPTDWFQRTVLDAIHRGASDLHVRVEDDGTGTSDVLTARLRIDGRMRHLETIEGPEARVILNRFKAQADLSTNGSYVPEETIYEVEVDGELRKARVALFRTAAAGDALVLRLPPAGHLLQLEDLNFAPRNEEMVNELLHASNRMLMIAGPMGSGKTTTAHACLQKVTTAQRSVWSLEDPVERDLPGVTQLEIDEENGAGFDALLPVLVRSDYDTLFLGEIRDHATAAAGVRQAKAGRQVITTIHANDNVTALYRLIELAKDSPLSVLDSVVGVISQRLVGRLNPDWDGMDPNERYKGRVPIHEVLRITPELIEAVMRDTPMTEVQQIASAASESTFLTDGHRLVTAGITDRDEVFRVLGRAN